MIDLHKNKFFEFLIHFRKCPPTLAAAITREVYEQAKKIDFREFEERPEGSNEVEAKEENSSNEIQRPESGRDSSDPFMS